MYDCVRSKGHIRVRLTTNAQAQEPQIHRHTRRTRGGAQNGLHVGIRTNFGIRVACQGQMGHMVDEHKDGESPDFLAHTFPPCLHPERDADPLTPPPTRTLGLL